MSGYRVTYAVEAPNKIMALMAAGRLLRTGVYVTELVDARPLNGGWWEVVLAVDEADPPEPTWLHEDPRYVGMELPETADPLTAAKAEADR